MAIPEAQLVTWCNQGATATAESTHTSIRYALEIAGSSRVSGHDIEIFLQGSYRNFTNIRADSDIDVVALLNETYTADSTRLTDHERHAQQANFAQGFPPPYPWETFRHDVLESLRQHYGPALVQQNNKAIKVLAGSGRLAADVVPAVVHRVYTSFGTRILTPETFIEGISFWDQSGRQVINYPKEHIKNGFPALETSQPSGIAARDEILSFFARRLVPPV